MKKTIALLTLLLGMVTIPSAAQDCTICGDWIGHYYAPNFVDEDEDIHYEDAKIYIRIKPNGESVFVRVKRELLSRDTDYEDDNTVYYDITSPNSISWSYKTYTDFESGRHNGNHYDKSEWHRCYSATITGNKMVCTCWLRIRYLRKTTTNTREYGYEEWWVDVGYKDFPTDTYTLYKDDGDW